MHSIGEISRNYGITMGSYSGRIQDSRPQSFGEPKPTETVWHPKCLGTTADQITGRKLSCSLQYLIIKLMLRSIH
jgi:hypothetical protein